MSFARKTPLGTNQDDVSALDPGGRTDGAFPADPTFGPFRGWEAAAQWARTHDVLPDLLLAIDATRIAGAFNRLGTVLRELQSPVAHELLSTWDYTFPGIVSLRRLSDAVVRHPDILNSYCPLPTEKAARRQLMGDLPRDYLLAMQLEQLPSGSTREREWFIALRLWVFAHAMRRAARSNVSDSNLRQVADALRKAGDGTGEDWRTLLLRLQAPTNDFLEFNSCLARMAGRLREYRDDSVTDTQARVLAALIRVAEHRHSDDRQSGSADQLLYGTLDSPSSAAGLPVTPLVLCDPGDGETEVTSLWSSPSKTDDDSDPATELAVPPEQSYEHQRLHAESVLLASAAELQLLPWSSSRPNPHEADALDKWVEVLLADSDDKHRLLGALIWIARHTGRSLRRALDIAISDQLQREWAYSPSEEHLTRIPPMRYSSWLPASDEELGWVTHLAERNRLAVPPAVARSLGTAIERSVDAEVLGQLWHGQESPEVFLREVRPANLARVTPGMLGTLLPLELYAETSDAAFASLVASHPQSGLQAACAYGNWTIAQVEQALNNVVTLRIDGGKQASDIGGGSRLDPIESLLREAVAAASKKVEELAAGADTVTFHNAYTAYVTMALLAATGVRPTKDPFEAYWHFDFQERFLFVNDKDSGEARAGRLIPLHREVSDWIVNGYCRYLGLLARLLSERHHALAGAIADMLAGHRSAALPFLFFLQEEPDLTWTSVSPSAIEGLGLFQWPLPLNLFRQRLAKQLRRRQVDPEVVDALLGHADNGAATHDDYSCRVWAADMREARPAIENAFDSLGWPLLTCHPRPLGASRATEALATSGNVFGAAARAEVRKVRVDHAKEHAREIVVGYLKGRQLAELDQDAIYELTKALVFNESGMPRALARQYYDVLDVDLDKIWKEKGQRLRVQRRFAWVRPTPSPFTDRAPGALQLHAQCTDRLDEAVATLQPSRLSLRSLGVLGPVALAIDHGVCDEQLLDDVSKGDNFRIVSLNGKIDLEYSPQMKGRSNDPDLPVRRFPISPRTASLLGRLIDGKKEIEPLKGVVPPVLDGLANDLRRAVYGTGTIDSAQALIGALLPIVDQVNIMTRPGVIAGYLAGRVLTYSLGWRDRIRLELGFIPRFENFEQDGSSNHDHDSAEASGPGPSIRDAGDTEAESLIANARKFYEGLRDELKPYLGELPTPAGPEKRRDVTARMHACIREWNGKVSPAVLLLGKWLASLVFRPKRSGVPLAMGTIGRYFSTLSPVFQDVAYDVDLVTLDEAGVTECYIDILKAHGATDRQYAGARLAEFHRWARQEGVEEPEWSELPELAHVIHVSPGVVTESEYQQALHLVMHDTSCDATTALGTAYLLLCCFRFGLRGAEVLGLLRSDWQDHGADKIVVIVRENRFRVTKGRRKQRQVPLLFLLSELERTVIQRWQILAEGRHGEKESVPVFSDGSNAGRLVGVHQLTRRANQVLKNVTGNPLASLHRLRHSAANRIALDVIWPEATCWRQLSSRGGASANRADIERMLLLRSGPTRRKAWAISTFLGHASRATTFKSYLHFVADWTRATAPADLAKPAIGSIVNLIELRSCERAGELSTDLLATSSRTEPLTIESALQLLRSIGRGRSAADAADALGADPACAEELSRAVTNVGDQMHLTPKSGEEASRSAHEFVARVTVSGWSRLYELARTSQERCASEKTEEKRIGNVGPSDVVEMIGATRQILMWKPQHFALMRRMCSCLTIGSERYTVIRSNMWNDRLAALAHDAGFTAKQNDEIGGRKRLQLDSAWEGENRNRVERRCAFLFQENHDYWIRNRLEFCVMLLAFAAVERT